jgi:hypothetical protein
VSARQALLQDEVQLRIADLEERRDLLRYEIDGWCAWPVLRKAVADSAAATRPSSPGGVSRGARLADALSDLAGLAKLRQARLFVKSYTSGLLETQGDKRKDIWFDDLLLAVGSFVKIETCNSMALRPYRRDALVPIAMTTALVDLVSGSVMPRLRHPPHIDLVSRELAAAIQAEFGSVVTQPSVLTALTQFVWHRRFYRRVLERVRPKHVITADSGEYGLTAAARGLGITVVELQHGITDRFNSGYSWTAYAVPYRERMPVPDKLFLYGDFWARDFEPLGFWRDSMCIVGSPRVDAYREARARGPLTETILFTSQGIDTEACCRFLATLAGELRDSESRIAIKLHPIYDRDHQAYTDAFAGEPRVTIYGAGEGPSTFELLSTARLHLSVSSAVHYDALGLGVPTAVLPFHTHEIVLPLCAAGHAMLVNDAAALARRIRARELPVVSPAVSRYYFKADSIQNMKRELSLGA